MSTSTINGSAYPAPIDELMPAARELAIDLDRVPAQRELREHFRIGSEKATEIRNRLLEIERQYTAAAAEDPDLPEPEDEAQELVVEESEPQVTEIAGSPGPAIRNAAVWPLYLLALPASVAIWSGWVGLGGLTGFGLVHPLPGLPWGLADFQLNTAITLPIGFEAYAAYALRYWFGPDVPRRARRFARWSAIAAMLLGCLGQVAYHLMTAAGYHSAPWPITTVVACLPVGVLGMGAALAHLLRTTD